MEQSANPIARLRTITRTIQAVTKDTSLQAYIRSLTAAAPSDTVFFRALGINWLTYLLTFFYRTFAFSRRGEALAANQMYSKLDFYSLRHLARPPLIFTVVKKCEIWPRFSIPFALEPPSLRNGAIYMKSFNLIRPSELVSIVIRPRENNDENRERKFVKSSITQPCAVPDCAGIWYADALWATKPMKLW